MNKVILLIDDEKLPMLYFKRALEESGFNVIQCVSSEEAINYVANKDNKIDLIILDIMIPPGRKYKGSETQHGLITGYFILQDIRKERRNVPIIVLTNVSKKTTLKMFKNRMRVKIYMKMDCSPTQLVILAEKMSSMHM